MNVSVSFQFKNIMITAATKNCQKLSSPKQITYIKPHSVFIFSLTNHLIYIKKNKKKSKAKENLYIKDDLGARRNNVIYILT